MNDSLWSDLLFLINFDYNTIGHFQTIFGHPCVLQTAYEPREMIKTLNWLNLTTFDQHDRQNLHIPENQTKTNLGEVEPGTRMVVTGDINSRSTLLGYTNNTRNWLEVEIKRTILRLITSGEQHPSTFISPQGQKSDRTPP